MDTPLIFDIARGSQVDGPGIRSTVFLKGCPLRCVWCHNPESYSLQAELQWNKNKCILCSGCIRVCKQKAISNIEGHIVDSSKCILCNECSGSCVTGAIETIGKYFPPEKLAEILLRDSEYYKTSGGGITFSGGEPLIHPEYLEEVCQILKEQMESISIAVQTCGYFNYELFEKTVQPYIQIFYYDLKIFSGQKHFGYTGVNNHLIIENLKKLLKTKTSKKNGYNPRIIVRTPLVPLITDTDDNIMAIQRFVQEIGADGYELLPYNPAHTNR